MPIHWATESNQIEIVKDLLNYTNKTQPGDFQGLTPIHMAASLGLLDMVKFWTNFNSNNWNKEPKSNYWNTPLHLAVNGGHLDVVKYLYNQNYEDGNYNYKLLLNKEIMSPIHVAAKMGHLDIMKFLFEKIKTPPTGPNRYNSYVSYKYQVKDHWVKKDQRGWTPVHWAAKNGHQDNVEFESSFCLDFVLKALDLGVIKIGSWIYSSSRDNSIGDHIGIIYKYST